MSDLPVSDKTTRSSSRGAYQNMARCGSDDEEIKKEKGGRAGWYRGGNSTLRRHIAVAHYEEYAMKCKEAGVEEMDAAVPLDVQEERKRAAEKALGKSEKRSAGGQTTLDSAVHKVQVPTAFSQEGILDAVTKHIVCGDQVCQFSRGRKL